MVLHALISYLFIRLQTVTLAPLDKGVNDNFAPIFPFVGV